MEKIILSLRNMLKEAIKVETYEKNLEINMLVKSNTKLGNDFADPNEIKIMLHMFGGLNQDFPMEIKIDEDQQIIRLIFGSLDNMNIVQKALETIWAKSVDLLEQCIAGDFSGIRNIGDVDD